MNQNWELDEKLCSLTREAAKIRLAPDDYFYMIKKYQHPVKNINESNLRKIAVQNYDLYISNLTQECYYKSSKGYCLLPNTHCFPESCIIQDVYKYDGYNKAKECLDEMKRIYSKKYDKC